MCKRHRHGFTLIEIMVSLAILGIVIAMIFSFFLYNTKIYTMAHYEATIQSECTEIMELVTVAAKESSAIILRTKAGADDPDIYELTRTPEAGGDVTVMHHVNKLEINMNGREYIYDFIDEFEIREINDNLREIWIVGRRKNEERSFSTTVSMRNQPPTPTPPV